MSAAPIRQQRPVPASAPRDRRHASEPARHLRPVAAPPHARSLAPLAWTCILIVIGALLTMLMINTQMSKGAFERRDLKLEIAALHQEASTLSDELEANSSPSYLSQRASALGMEPASTLGVVSLADGAVLEQGE